MTAPIASANPALHRIFQNHFCFVREGKNFVQDRHVQCDTTRAPGKLTGQDTPRVPYLKGFDEAAVDVLQEIDATLREKQLEFLDC